MIDYARNTAGLPMRGLHGGHHIGYTTDAAKAEKMRDVGASVTRCHGTDQDSFGTVPPATFASWEISFAVGREIMEEENDGA